ncbi:hypothetical protein SBA4_480007 [Candidatus Sulfopaludibacter sp. SbA4]|nr:hypothetical protein SBA4_480007 [Candidatus Sulfopaludibacter sp. SbA4]
MNPDALALPTGLNPAHVGDLLGFSGMISERSAKRLPASAGELIQNVASILDEMVVGAIGARTAQEFSSIRDSVFEQYFSAVRALSDLARIVVPGHVLDGLAAESFCELEADIHERGLAAFGAALRDQAMFAVWTMRKTADLCQRINAAQLPVNLREDDASISSKFAIHAVWARFHLDCLIKSMRLRRPLYPEVMEGVTDGLRSAVDAYALARRALDLRLPAVEPEIPPVDWDDEEQALLDDATYDSAIDIV